MGDENRKRRGERDNTATADKAMDDSLYMVQSDEVNVPNLATDGILDAVSEYDAGYALEMLADNQDLAKSMDEESDDSAQDSVFTLPERVLSGKSADQGKDFYSSKAEKKKDDRYKKVKDAKIKDNLHNRLSVDADIDLLNAVTGATGKPKTSEDYAQLVALAQKNIGFGNHAIDGQYGKNTQLLLKNENLDNMGIGPKRLSFLKKSIERRDNDVDIELDKTEALLQDRNNGYDADVKEFLAYLKANKKVENGKDVYPRNIPYDMIKRFVLKGNYGLVNLLIGVANYGILPGTLPKPLQTQDPFQYSDEAKYRNKAIASPFQSVNIGKGAFDYDKGGIGIPHFDVHNIHELYVEFGLPPCELSELYVNHEVMYTINDRGLEKPCILSKPELLKLKRDKNEKPKSKVFDELKNNKIWLSWLESLVQRDDVQVYLFKQWAKNYWIDNLNNYKSVKDKRKGTGRENQHVAMQDLTLNSRIGNSMSSTSFVGLSPEQQAMVYIAFKEDDHVSRQLPNVQRVNLLIEYIVEHEVGQQSNAQPSPTHVTPAPNSSASSSANDGITTQTSLSETEHSSRTESAAIHAPLLVTKALRNLNLLPDVQSDKLLDDEKETSAVNYNRKRAARLNADIQKIAMAAYKPMPATDEDKAQTIAHAQKNLGLGITNPDNIDGKYGKNTQKAVADSDSAANAPIYANNQSQNDAPTNSDDTLYHKEGASQTDLADTELASADIATAKDEYENNYKTLGLIPYSEAAFANVVNHFGQNADKATAIAQLIVWARIQKNPSIAFPIFQGGIYNDNKDLIKRVTEAQNYEKQKQKAQSSPSDLASDVQNAPDNDVHDSNAVASEPDFSDVSPELMQAMLGKSDVKKTLRGDALFNAFKANDAKAFEAEKTKVLSAYYALQLYGIQCNDVTELMVSIAYGSQSDETKFFAKGFKGTIFRPESSANPSLEARYLTEDYETTRQSDNLESQLKKISDGQKRTAYLEQFRDRLHGKGDPAWNDAKEGDFIMQFQGADLKKEKNGKLDQDNSYAEDQFRHVAVIVKIIHAQDLNKSEFKAAIIAGKNIANPLSNKEKNKLSSDERARVEAEEKLVRDSYNEYVERAYRENHRIATTMGAGSQGVGINDKGWKAISPHSLDYNENRNLLWHDMDEDWYRNGIIRTGNAADTSRIQKVYLFK